jgi:hypothetical protein
MMELSLVSGLRAPRADDSPPGDLPGGGAMGAAIRGIDWSRTALGPIAGWPQSLRTALGMMLDARFAMAIGWGPELWWFYNDCYEPLMGPRHPETLGAPVANVFADCWEIVGPAFAQVARGEAFALEDWYLPVERGGRLEHGWFTLSCSPIRDETGGVGGVLVIVADVTAQVENQRRSPPRSRSCAAPTWCSRWRTASTSPPPGSAT